ncbi:hypothetical protein [Kitasatospora sp. NBC_01300]|uniref:hypothetical protein n=1 Tax=Kitasatospora sp. NBC_01300 TaxID=2903574 RepID=UPI00352CF2A6|nr:hypothetical protein OG556_09890 [Kitasatospora sp. NBC_01300]
MGIGDKFRDKAEQLEEEAKSRLGNKPPKGDDAQQKAAQTEQQGQQNLDDLQDDIDDRK